MDELTRVLALLFAMLPASPCSGGQDPPRPAPDAAAQKEAEKLIREVFKEDYAKKTPADRIALAKKLLKQGTESKDDPAPQFVLFSEARDLASQSGIATTALQAVDEMSKRFKIAALPMKANVLATVAAVIKTPDESRVAATLSLAFVEEASAEADFESAEKGLQSGLSLARKAKDVRLVTLLEARVRQTADLKNWHGRAQKAMAVLATTPEDPAAHLEVGRYLCLAKGDWASGLLHWAKGGDPAVKALAEKDLSNPVDPGDIVGVGDGWWELGEKESGQARTSLRRRAANWYAKAFPALSGLSRAKVEKRIAEGGAPVADAFPQDDGAEGLVSIEAEHFHSNLAKGAHEWKAVSTPAGASGSGAMQAVPDQGANLKPGPESETPRLDYRVMFVKTGVHYVWLRGYAVDDGADSCHVGVDGKHVPTCDSVTWFNASGSWSRQRMDHTPATFVVDQPGLRTVNIWMREDGFVLDKILITTNPGYTPSNKGPAESTRR